MANKVWLSESELEEAVANWNPQVRIVPVTAEGELYLLSNSHHSIMIIDMSDHGKAYRQKNATIADLIAGYREFIPYILKEKTDLEILELEGNLVGAIPSIETVLKELGMKKCGSFYQKKNPYFKPVTVENKRK